MKKLSKKHKENIGKAMKGREIFWKDKISKALTGRKLSEAHKRKISDSQKGMKKPWVSEFCKGRDPWNKGKKLGKNPEHSKRMTGRSNKWGHHSQKSKIKISAFQQGISVDEWNEFKLSKVRFLRNCAKAQIWRNLVFLRDNFTCQNPNCKFCGNKIGVYLHAHHIKSLKFYPELFFDVNNGITYCKDFHLKSRLHKEMQKEVN